jgi:hypothetical protein
MTCVSEIRKYYSWTFFCFFEDTDPNVKNLGEMTAKLYESIKLRLDQLADKGIGEYWRHDARR